MQATAGMWLALSDTTVRKTVSLSAQAAKFAANRSPKARSGHAA